MTIKLAKALAEAYHEGQMYGDKPYTFHIEMVVENVKQLYATDKDLEDLIQVAYLHDILEDTFITEDTLKAIFSKDVFIAVQDITKGTESYDTYIQRLRYSKLARKVKVADSLANLQCSLADVSSKRVIKYTNVLRKLT